MTRTTHVSPQTLTTQGTLGVKEEQILTVSVKKDETD